MRSDLTMPSPMSDGGSSSLNVVRGRLLCNRLLDLSHGTR